MSKTSNDVGAAAARPSRERARAAAARPSRERILAVAHAAIDAGTFDALSLDAVRAEAGVSNGSLYYHFPSWAHLVDGAYAAIIGAYQDHLLEAVAGVKTGRRCLAALVAGHVRWCERHPERARFLRRGRTRVSRDAKDAIHERNARFIGAIIAQLRAGGADPALPDDLLAAFLVGPLDAYARGRVEGRRGTSPAEATRILTEKLALLILGSPERAPARRRGGKR